MALPATLAMGVNALYNVVDTAFIGRGVDPLAIGGLSIAFPMQIVVLAIGLMVGIGSASIVSRSLGAGDEEKAARTVANGFLVGIVTVALVTVAARIFVDPLLRALGATENLIGYSREYLVTVLPGGVFIAIAIGSNHVVRSEGRATFSMGIMLTGALLNILLDWIFIFPLGMGIRGAALATVIAQFASFCVAMYFYASKTSSLTIRARHFRLDRTVLREMLSLGAPSFVRQFAASFFIIITNNMLSTYGGDLSIAAFGVIHKILIFGLMPLIGIAQGFQPIAGFNYGAGNMARVRAAVKTTFGVSIVAASAIFAAIMLFPEAVFRIFTADAELTAIGSDALRIVLLALPLIALQVTGAVFFQAVGKAVPALILSLSRQVIFLIPLMLLLPRFLGITGVWTAFPAADVLAVAVTLLWMRHAMKQLRIVECESDPQAEGCADTADQAVAAEKPARA